MKKIYLLLTAALIFLYCDTANAQLLDPVSYQITDAPEQVKAGEKFSVIVRAEIDGDWHLYSALNDPDAGPYPTTFSSGEENLQIAGTVSESEVRIVLDPNFNAKLGWHSDEAHFTVPLAFDTTAAGNNTITLDILYQVCDDKSCLPPKTKQVSAEVLVSGISESPFIGGANSGKNILNSFYTFPSGIISSLNGVEWIFWLFFSAAALALALAVPNTRRETIKAKNRVSPYS